jgi:hypothetical protein
MPTLTVIKHFDVIKNIAAGFFPRSVIFSLSVRVSTTGKTCNRIIMAVTATAHAASRPCDFRNDCHSWLVPALIRMNQHLFWGLRRHTAISSAFRTMSFVIRDCMDQPIILRENRSTTGKIQPAFVGPDVGYVVTNAHPEHPD